MPLALFLVVSLLAGAPGDDPFAPPTLTSTASLAIPPAAPVRSWPEPAAVKTAARTPEQNTGARAEHTEPPLRNNVRSPWDALAGDRFRAAAFFGLTSRLGAASAPNLGASLRLGLAGPLALRFDAHGFLPGLAVSPSLTLLKGDRLALGASLVVGYRNLAEAALVSLAGGVFASADFGVRAHGECRAGSAELRPSGAEDGRSLFLLGCRAQLEAPIGRRVLVGIGGESTWFSAPETLIATHVYLGSSL